MKKLKNGEPSTLGTYRRIAFEMTEREDSFAVRFFDRLIERKKEGAEKIVHRSQAEMMQKIVELIIEEKKNPQKYEKVSKREKKNTHKGYLRRILEKLLKK